MITTLTPVQIRFSDIDKMGHVNNATYVTYLELARLDYFQKIGGKIDWHKLGIILGRIEINYVAPVVLHDNIVIKTWCSRLGTKSFELSHSIIKTNNSAETEMVNAVTVKPSRSKISRSESPIFDSSSTIQILRILRFQCRPRQHHHERRAAQLAHTMLNLPAAQEHAPPRNRQPQSHPVLLECNRRFKQRAFWRARNSSRSRSHRQGLRTRSGQRVAVPFGERAKVVSDPWRPQQSVGSRRT